MHLELVCPPHFSIALSHEQAARIVAVGAPQFLCEYYGITRGHYDAWAERVYGEGLCTAMTSRGQRCRYHMDMFQGPPSAFRQGFDDRCIHHR